MKYTSFLGVLGSLLFSACAVEEVEVAKPTTVDENGMQTITVVSASFDQPATRVSAQLKPEGGYTFPWQGGDKIAVFGSSDQGKGWGFFTLADGNGDTTGKFTGIFKLQDDVQYYSFYPSKKFDSDTNEKAVPVDYTGQVQTQDASLSHLSNYIYMAAKGDKTFNFTSKHVGSLLKIQFQDPDYATANKITLSTDADDFVLKGTIDLTTATASAAPSITATEKASTFEIGYSAGSATVEDNTITVYAMMAPTDLSGKTIKATITHANGSEAIYALDADPANPFERGKAYAFTSTFERVVNTPYVTFSAASSQTLIMDQAVEGLEYSVGGGKWELLGTNEVEFGGAAGDLRLRGTNGWGTVHSSTSQNTIHFGNDTKVACTGDIRTLVDYRNYETASMANARFAYLFQGCEQLTSAPALPATDLATGCYQDMFSYCFSLEVAPALPATTLAENCYSGMFYYCYSLEVAPALPATTLAEDCYNAMFTYCSSLKTAPELPATELEPYCYTGMFNGCTSLTTAPALPATELKTYCYAGMFNGCTSLTTAPELPAEGLIGYCYYAMFQGCSKLNYVKAAFTTTPGESYTRDWLQGVAPTGTFVKNPNATWDVTGASGVPSGWTVETPQGEGYDEGDTTGWY